MKIRSLTTGDVVTLNGRRGRILAAAKGQCEVLLSTGAVECDERQVRRINAWWNTPEMRAAFHSGRRCKRRVHIGRGARPRAAGPSDVRQMSFQHEEERAA